MSFDRAKRPVEDFGYFAVREPLLIAEMKYRLFFDSKGGQCPVQVFAQIAESRGRRSWLELIQVLLLKRRTTLTPSGIAPMVVRDAEQPCQKTGSCLEPREALPGTDERILREIVGQRGVTLGQMPEEATHGRLMAAYEFPEGRLILIQQRANDQF